MIKLITIMMITMMTMIITIVIITIVMIGDNHDYDECWIGWYDDCLVDYDDGKYDDLNDDDNDADDGDEFDRNQDKLWQTLWYMMT